jgi:2-keto-3-deoxy-L-rhamnonate aldolase
MSHGNVSHHIQVSLNPSIDHSYFRLYSGFGQQLFPVVFMGGSGVIDGLAAIYPRTVTKLFDLSCTLPIDKPLQDEISKLQFLVSRAEEMIGKWGIVGIKSAIFRVLAMGNAEGSRLPLKGNMDDAEWTSWKESMDAMQKIEDSLNRY